MGLPLTIALGALSAAAMFGQLTVEAAMILVAACPGGSLSNVITHFGRGNTALSVSISAVAAVMALVLTPFNFAWMMAANPATAGWGLQITLAYLDHLAVLGEAEPVEGTDPVRWRLAGGGES